RAVLTVVLVALVIVELYLFTGFLPTRWQVAINDTLCRILPQTYDPFSRHASCHRPRNRTGNERAHRVEIDCVGSLYWDAAGEHVLNSLGGGSFCGGFHKLPASCLHETTCFAVATVGTASCCKQALSQPCAFCSPDRRKESANLC